MTELQETPPRVLRETADALHDAEVTRIAMAPPTSSHVALTLDDAYEVQRINVRRRLDAGERIIGRKIGLTSEAMQRQLGVDQPDFGVITDAMVVPEGSAFSVNALIAPRVEAEFAFRIGSALPPSPTIDELIAAVDGVALALEIIDSRIADWRIGLRDTVADNASSARIVHGEFLRPAGLLTALPTTEIHLERDGVIVATGPGSAVLGDPLVSLHWLARAIGTYGDVFEAGQVVLAGAVAAAVPLDAGRTWTARAEGFPSTTFTSI